MSNVTGLICRECGNTVDAIAQNQCDICFGPMDVNYNYARVKKLVTKKRIRKGPASIWRYREFLPVESEKYVDLSPGFTPLQRAERLGEELGIKNLFLKNDTINPTFSCKDRMVCVAMTRALELKFDIVACASTGNLAQSLAAYAAKSGLKSYIFVPAGSDEIRLSSTNIYDPVLLGVKGDPTQLNKLCSEIMLDSKWGFINVNLRPYYAEGAKTLAYEVAEQLDWKTPDHLVVPLGSGTTITKIHQGFQEMVDAELLRHARLTYNGVQPTGCSPIVKAFDAKSELIQPETPSTIAKSLAVGNPADGHYALKIIRGSDGMAVSVTDKDIRHGIKTLARLEGIFAEPAGGAVVASLAKMAAQRHFKATDTVVAYITGAGLKTPDIIKDIVPRPRIIEPTIASLDEAIASINRQKFVPGAPAGDKKSDDEEAKA